MSVTPTESDLQRPQSRRGRRVVATLLAGVVVAALVWALPYGSHSTAELWEDEAPAALSTFGEPTLYTDGWDLRADTQRVYALEGSDDLPDQMAALSVSVLRYGNSVQAEFWSRVQDPEWNGVAWDDQGPRRRIDPAGLGLPPGARLYGLQCGDEGSEACGRYFVWLRDGADLIVVDVSVAGKADGPRQGLQGLDALWSVGNPAS